MALISIQWPRSMMVIRAASSHQKSRSNHPEVVAAEATKATVIAIPMSSIIPG
jgi:Holliday junction resolvase